ncbi:uncharacterized protein L201_004885 [Kwoniella dendrophila CBS 6074]|uniref:DUF2415 domain-containing protein n=1 Tax=Kwoniella dendrophila CBS 6074 TaxID=1295534 RepID=A0AAX4JX31_9TREE
MARDPPSLLSSSELRDISLTPTAVRSAKITIIHPQLRDLILPIERGRVLYPRGMTIEEQRWLPAASSESDEEEGIHKRGITGSTRPLLNLNFVPNCLTASQSILACGGQHGELHICDLPQPPTNDHTLTNKYISSPPKIKPFTLSTTLSGRSINNSIIIPPTWPNQWSKVSEQKKLGYIGRGSRKWEEYGLAGKQLLGKTENGQWVTRDPSLSFSDLAEDDIYMEDDDEVMEGDEAEDEDGDSDTEVMSIDEDEQVEYEVSAQSPISDASVATYPNTVPFLHAPRIPHLANPISTSTSRSGYRDPSTLRRTASFSSSSRNRDRDYFRRQSFSSVDGSGQRYGHPPIQIVSSRRQYLPRSSRAESTSSSSRVHRGIIPPNPRRPRSNNYKKPTIDEPRILISNNDCTVKMFSLHSTAPSGAALDPIAAPFYEQGHEPFARSTTNLHTTRTRDTLSARPLDRLGLGAPRSSHAASSRSGTSFEWISASDHNSRTHRHHHPIATSSPFTLAERETLSIQRELQRASEGIRVEQANLRRNRENFERVIGMSTGVQNSASSVELENDAKEVRKLNKVGGTRFKVATNHSSLSPDLKTMVSVGDSTEVSIFEIIDGGREFRKIAVYDAATDAGFSTSWSKDGRKFAVASQDGQVTVWDHRSSKPLAMFHTSADRSSNPSEPSFMNDISASHLSNSPSSSSSGEWNLVGPEGITLRDPITGTPRTGTSTSGKEAARVVKFSPEGSNRDLMVFSEENSNIHLIDAQTFHTHVVIPVPHIPWGTADPDASARPRQGVENGTWGIAGVGFDQTGDWLYSGTERTVVEWDLRRNGGDEGGVWELA